MTPIYRVYTKILEIYPFLTDKEKRVFISRAKPFLIKYQKTNIPREQISLIKSILLLLNNEHADLKEIKTKRHKLDCDKSMLLKPKIELRHQKRVLTLIVPSWSKNLGDISNKLIEACLKYRERYDSILIDVRDNSGGNSRIAHNFASIFFNKSVRYGTFISRGKNNKLKRKFGLLKPHGEIYIDVPVAILISKRCFSSNELFLAPFKVSGRAILVGDYTRGGSANPLSERISVGNIEMTTRVPRWRFILRGKEKPIEKTKIEPDIRYLKGDIISFSERYLKNLLIVEIRG